MGDKSQAEPRDRRRQDVISQEVASQEFERWAETWDIDTAEGFMAEDEREVFKGMRSRLERKIRAGALVIDDEGNPHFTPQFSDVPAMTFKIPTGADRLGWDKYKERESIHRIFSSLGSMTGQASAVFSRMDGRDLKVAEAIALLYLGS
jgi:hypothetical protein